MTPRESWPHPSTAGSSAQLIDLRRKLLEEYGVTSNGFLPETAPLDRFPDPYYAPWETLIDSLPTLIETRTLRAQVDQLPVLSTDRLITEEEWRRACVVLSFLTHGYIWGGDVAAEILPPPLTIPLLAVTAHLGLPPIATYASLNLWNFRTASSNPAVGSPDLTDLDSLQAQHTFTGTPDESWFYVVSVAIEARGAALVPTMLAALGEAAPRRDLAAVTAALGELRACVAELGRLLDRMHERCRPAVFYHRIRPFLAGSKNMAAAGLPRGVFYDVGRAGEGGGGGGWRQLRGGSNGQSSLIQFLDLVLGVEHHAARANGRPEEGEGRQTDGDGAEGSAVSFHEEVRDYMPEPHRRFLRYVAEAYPGGMRKVVGELLAAGERDDEKGSGQLSAEQKALQEAFQTATKALAEFRNQHLQIVARYIIIPSKQAKAAERDGVVNLATASSRGKGVVTSAGDTELTGTGGTALLPFLKQSRDETFQAGELVSG